MRAVLRVAWMVVALCLAQAAGALDPRLAISQYQLSQWHSADGLPHSSISALFEDRDGFIWVGTYRGAARFDGKRFLPLAELIGEPLDSDLVETIGQTADGVLWFGGTYRSLVLLAPDGRVRRYGAGQGLPDRQITAVFTDAGGQRWLGTRSGLLRVDGPWDRLRFSADLPQIVWQLVQWQGDLYAASERGVWRRRGNTWEHLFADTALANVHVWALEPDGGRLWIGYRGGLASFDGRALQLLAEANGLPHPVVRALARDRDGNLWIGTSGAGIARLAAGRFDTLGDRDGGVGGVTWGMVLGRDGTLWMASASGLSRLKNASVRNYGRPEGLRSAMVWGTLDDRRGGRYVAFNGEGLAHVDVTGQARHFGAPNGPPGAGIVISMAHDGDDLLLATFSGLYRFHDGRFTREPAVPADRVHAIHVLAQDDVLLGMHGGLWRLRGQRLARIPSSLREPVLRMRTEADGSLLVAAGRDGAWRLQGDRMSALASRPGTEVRDVFRASDGRIYAAGLGLFVIDRGRLLPLLPINQAQVGQMHAITESADRKLWINSNLGVIRVALDQVDAWLGHRRQGLPFQVVDETHGMRSSEGNGGQNSADLDRDGKLWLATTAGVAVIDTRADLEPPLPPLQVHFERRLEDGQGRFAGATQAVTAGVRRLQVEYTVASPAWADALGFEYRLLPLDRDWVDNGSLRSIAMGRPPPGDYRLDVRARRGGTTGETASLEFSVAAFWWQHRWVQRSALLATVLLTGLLVWWRVLALRRQRDVLERQVQVRTTELAAANAQLADAARRDFLTGIGNRRCFTERLNALWALTPEIALAVVDVDHFKAYNDRLGHLQGDQCLRAIGATLRTLEGADIEVFRVGGEEFALLAAHAAADRIGAVLGDLRRALATAALAHPGSDVSPWVTLSAGHALRSDADQRPEDLYARADAALYRAKAEGRDRIVS
ncbi:MAG: diguanylate cyclase [Thermomonas sp.]|uniref:ligand-binding sensor domain-containing diguanylate cyclase n=1 Tax=Thermomonas sp. TaxID=1971895 RepID=UPI001B623D3D|nr:ligand-binding sensor domain-containing diguanylate cyclase [Thermomonas sp.]MBK7204647.1 diguanylate cyclase [Thermomonas sp.]MBP8648130.1 diguanylate cyclase [Thermomonas sp.]